MIYYQFQVSKGATFLAELSSPELNDVNPEFSKMSLTASMSHHSIRRMKSLSGIAKC
jgi:hypothetical protein